MIILIHTVLVLHSKILFKRATSNILVHARVVIEEKHLLANSNIIKYLT
jgi:hypothetical protein